MLHVQITLNNSDGDCVDITESVCISLPKPDTFLKLDEETLRIVANRALSRLIAAAKA